MYLNIWKDFLDKKGKDLLEEANAEYGYKQGSEEYNSTYLFKDDLVGKITDFDFNKNKILVEIDNLDLGYLSLEVEITTDDMIKLLEYAIKKLNKYKTAIEALK